MPIEIKSHPDLKDLTTTVYGMFDPLEESKNKRYSELTSDELMQMIDIANRAIIFLDDKLHEYFSLDIESREWRLGIESLKQHLQGAIKDSKDEMQKRAAMPSHTSDELTK
nr:hypothetical protein [Candidatus Sigynarchaeota archaeon]